MDGVKITGLWKHKTKDGHTYLSGTFSGITQLSVMPNTFKRSEKDPDYFVYVVPFKKKGDVLQTQIPQSDDL
jgi:hypothetical protein